jgi:hypothetical protein
LAPVAKLTTVTARQRARHRHLRHKRDFFKKLAPASVAQHWALTLRLWLSWIASTFDPKSQLQPQNVSSNTPAKYQSVNKISP